MHGAGSGERPPPSSVGAGAAAVVVDRAGVVLFSTPGARTLLTCPPGSPCPALVAALQEAGHAVEGHARASGRPPGLPGTLVTAVVPLESEGTAAADAGPWLVLLEPGGGEAAGAARRRAELAHLAALTLGESLDVAVVAQTLADLLVPGFADLATVDLVEAVLVGDEPPQLAASSEVRLRRVAAAQSPGVSAEHLLPVGEAIPPLPESAVMSPLMEGRAVVASDIGTLRATLGVNPETLRSLIPDGAHSSVAVPLYARGLVLGCLTLWRGPLSDAFTGDDGAVLEGMASHAALSVDNARRYTREHRSAVVLQRSLLPHAARRLPGAETAGVYQPRAGGTGAGGDWYDVIPLPSLRVGLVVGDVVGHGLHATAAMARLRTAVRALADLDLEPDELLTHLDDLVLGFSDGPDSQGPDPAVLGATCLYAVYDPVSCTCSLSSAGHPPPAVLTPSQRTPSFPGLTPGPPLGVGSMPFVTTHFDAPAGSLLALFTDGLVTSRTSGIDEGMTRLREALAQVGGAPLGEASRELVGLLTPPTPADDAALLLVRTRTPPARHIAAWELRPDLEDVARARELVATQLAEWHLDEAAFVTELIVSELVTNAIRYVGGPVGLRLIRGEEALVCEVSDTGTTQPRVRRARETDEGGRGLFLVSQLADRWGSRFTQGGKTIWSEQAVGTPADGAVALVGP
ncbi:SpoIIE family protein phosphatase [Streptomyces sp. NPDC020800]|uniref:ATP-binding SpoIIE family protein phosphatase n=1 Tax=Streptomyces sp. NPDC020800 TaxID=3365092 RepID=UPI00379C322D